MQVPLSLISINPDAIYIRQIYGNTAQYGTLDMVAFNIHLDLG